MIDLVKYLVTQIVDHPEDIQIKESVDETNSRLIILTVNPEDMGKVIGKGGKIISAIREIVKVKAIKIQQRVRLVLKDPEEFDPSSKTPTETETEIPTKPTTEPELSIDLPTQTDSLSPSEPQE